MTVRDEAGGSDSLIGGRFPTADEAAQHVERACRAVVDGRRAGRMLTSWCKHFTLGEADFQVLWTLRLAAPESLDQATLASRLALSPAQVSTTVERLRARNRIWRTPSRDDRRRNLWQLTADGERMLSQMLANAQELRIGDFGLRISEPGGGHRSPKADGRTRPGSQTTQLASSRNPRSEEEAA